MANKTIHAIIEGRVQGVYFRDYTRREAERLGLGGWVRNLRDGSVEALIAGESDKVDQMLAWLHRGSPLAIVTGVTTMERSHEDTFPDFTIRY
jgi:acylphosphatase